MLLLTASSPASSHGARRHDDELEPRPLMDYGIEAADGRCIFDAASRAALDAEPSENGN
jgi:hypothetical protein